MSIWEEQGFEEKVTEILRAVQETDHHFGRAFMTAYQLAIEFNRRFPDDVARLGYKVGGAGIGENVSLAQYLARELSRRIKSDSGISIQGAFLSNARVTALTYDNEGESIRSSLTGSEYALSMFRLA